MPVITIDDKSYQLDPVTPPKEVNGKIIDTRWKITFNGQDITDDVETLTLINVAMGIGFLYGTSPAGAYNQGRIVNRGGAVILGHKRVNGIDHVLSLRQIRPLHGPLTILELPRGQALEGEDPAETAVRELSEETGLHIDRSTIELLGIGNPDTALVHDANVACVAFEVPDSYIVLTETGPQLVGNLNAKGRIAEQIKSAQFTSVLTFKSPSQMSQWAVGLYCQQLLQEKSES